MRGNMEHDSARGAPDIAGGVRGMTALRRVIVVVLAAVITVGMTACAPPALLDKITSHPEAEHCVSNVGAGATDALLANAEAVAMPEASFWGWIDKLGGTSEEDYDRLTEELSNEPIETIAAFDARMTIQLYLLDDECRAAWYEDREGYVSDDVFLYGRADTVSSGEKFFARALRDDTLPHAGNAPSEGDGEFLLYVAMDAATAAGATEREWDSATASHRELSYETGSNPAGWPRDQ